MDVYEVWQLIPGAAIGGGEPRMGEYTGTKALMLAVLEDGIRTYCGPTGRARNEAEYWVHSDLRWPFAFTVVCEALNLEPDAVRRALRRLQPQALPRRSVRRLRGNVRSDRPVKSTRRTKPPGP